jgi:hypothetical protein
MARDVLKKLLSLVVCITEPMYTADWSCFFSLNRKEPFDVALVVKNYACQIQKANM